MGARQTSPCVYRYLGREGHIAVRGSLNFFAPAKMVSLEFMFRRWTVEFDEELRMRCKVSSEVVGSNGAIIRRVQHYGHGADVSVADDTSGASIPKKLLEWFKVTTRRLVSTSQNA